MQEHSRATAELAKAHQIIRNALAIMTGEQKAEWGRLNERDGVAGEGVTRAHERQAVLDASQTERQTADLIRHAFGRHAVDVVALIRDNSSVLGWTAAIFRAITAEVAKEDPLHHQIKTLSEVGEFLGAFHADSLDYEVDQIVDSLSDAGINVEALA